MDFRDILEVDSVPGQLNVNKGFIISINYLSQIDFVLHIDSLIESSAMIAFKPMIPDVASDKPSRCINAEGLIPSFIEHIDAIRLGSVCGEINAGIDRGNGDIGGGSKALII